MCMVSANCGTRFRVFVSFRVCGGRPAFVGRPPCFGRLSGRAAEARIDRAASRPGFFPSSNASRAPVGRGFDSHPKLPWMEALHVEGMLHSRLSPPRVLQLPLRRMQESQEPTPNARPQSIHAQGAQARKSPGAGTGPTVRVPRRRARRMRQAPWAVRGTRHHRRPLAFGKNRTRRARPRPERPDANARTLQALPRQQDRKNETFGLQRPKPSMRSQSDDAPRSAGQRRRSRATRDGERKTEERRKRSMLFRFRLAPRRGEERVMTENVGNSTESTRRNTPGGTP